MPKKVDLTDKRFGRLIVTRETDKRINGNIIWECKCDCGKIHLAASNNLRNGDTKSCGCLMKEVAIENGKNTKGMNIKDLTGKKFGRLTIVKIKELDKKGNVIWECECDCGNLITARGSHLTAGNIQSCGCIVKERAKEWAKEFGQKILEENEWKEGTSLCSLTQKIRKNNKSGIKGVDFHEQTQKWRARIAIKGESKHLGLFDTLEEAAKARKRAEEKYFHPILEKYGRLKS